jgi:methionyl-tRNA formyltransferase
MKTENAYIVATPKPWNLAEFARVRPSLPGRWMIVTSPDDLEAAIAVSRPRYIFFPHWSHIVPRTIVETHECVCFHMTDLPYGRGGSPLQNLIERGHTQTALTALRMTEVLDGGPVYGKRPLALDGSAEEIFARAAGLIAEMIGWIAASEPVPQPQEGTPTPFQRRKPAQSRLPLGVGAEKLYDHIRMLDAPGYPKAYLEHDGWRLEFDSARLSDGIVEARVRFASVDGTDA